MRCPLVHIKDFIQDGEVKLVAVGDGVQDIKAIAEKAQECGAQWLVVEQDSHIFGSPMENMKKYLLSQKYDGIRKQQAGKWKKGFTEHENNENRNCGVWRNRERKAPSCNKKKRKF